MIENVNASKTPSNVEYVDVHKYEGVASVNVVAINPNNNTLRQYGWSISETADEPTYVTTVERDGKPVKSARVRFLVQIQDLPEKPVVALDFWVRPDIMVNKDGTKCKVIDAYGRTAWGTKEEVTAQRIPQYASGAANISTPYKPCHSGEEELIQFLFKYLNITPLQMFDRKKGEWLPSKNPGRLTIDNWNAVCAGNVRELVEYVHLQPENCVKVVLGVRSTDDNKTYQTFLNTGFIGNGASPDKTTGEYATARKLIDRYFENRDGSAYSFSAKPVQEWQESATEVKEQATGLFEGASFSSDEDDDLPFD